MRRLRPINLKPSKELSQETNVWGMAASKQSSLKLKTSLCTHRATEKRKINAAFVILLNLTIIQYRTSIFIVPIFLRILSLPSEVWCQTLLSFYWFSLSFWQFLEFAFCLLCSQMLTIICPRVMFSPQHHFVCQNISLLNKMYFI